MTAVLQTVYPAIAGEARIEQRRRHSRESGNPLVNHLDPRAFVGMTI